MVHNIILCYFIFDYFVGPVHEYWDILIFLIRLYPCIRLKYEDIVINNSKMSF